MRVGFYLADQNPARDRSLGITGYTDGLLRSLVRERSLEIVGLTSASSYLPPASVYRISLPFSTRNLPKRMAADNFHPLIRRPLVDLWHYPKGYLPVCFRYKRPIVGTVHDMIVQHYAERYPDDRSRLAFAYWTKLLKRSIPRFDLILSVSEFSAEAIRAFCGRFKCRCPPICVTYEGFNVESPVTPEKKRDVVVHLASRELHKRTSTLLTFWEKLTKTERDLPRLRLVGNMRPADEGIARSLRGVEIYGRLTRLQLEAEMARARALIFPSEVEGFGLPAVEAYALGTPVIYVSGTAVEEVLGDQTPGGFSLDSFDSFRTALNAVLGMSAPAVLARATELRGRFSWEKCANLTLSAYRTLAG